jgi:ketosteroid isomerase-like protein
VPDPSPSLLDANEAFYAAFEGRDLDAMSALWLHEDHVACTHPGWATLRGWPAVAASWFALFQGDHPMQFILTNLVAHERGEVGWVTLDENLIAGTQAQTVAATNLFTRVGGAWRLVLHHGSGIAPAE